MTEAKPYKSSSLWKSRSPSDVSEAASGFTLIELVVVMIIIALLTGGVTLTLGSHLQQARLAQAVDSVQSLDRMVRREAQRSGIAIAAKFDLSKDRLLINSSTLRPVTSLPRGISIRQVRSPGRNTSAGEAPIVFMPSGQSATYAVQLEAENKTNTWVVVLGKSGQTLRMGDEDEVVAILGG